MTEKRFNKVKVYLSYEIFDNKTNEQLNVNKIVELMNQLNEENEQLKEKLNEILELTEMTGMIHLRKAEIKNIIKR